MFEILIIMGILLLVKILPLRGKTLEQLDEKQLKFLERDYQDFQRSSKGKKNPDVTMEEHLKSFQEVISRQILFLCLAVAIYIVLLCSRFLL